MHIDLDVAVNVGNKHVAVCDTVKPIAQIGNHKDSHLVKLGRGEC